MRLIIPPQDPDLDSVASVFGYAEFLKKQEIDAVAAVFGDLNDRTQQLFERIDEEVSDATYYLYSADEITLVGASSMENVSRRIQQQKVTEVVDHVADNLSDFTEAEQEIDDSFSTAAAMIAAKFRGEEVDISQEAANVLYEAVKSADEVNGRDQEVMDWLEERKD